MKEEKYSLGVLGSKFFALMQTRRQEIVRLGDLQISLGLSSSQEKELLKRLAKKGYLLRLQRGIYLIPATLQPGGYWQPNEFYIIAKYMETLDAKYYIGGLSALHHYHLTEQIPNQLVVYNDKISRKKKFGKLAVQFIKVSTDNIEGITEFNLPNNQVVNLASLARTILDAVNDWKRYQTLPSAYLWITEHYGNKNFLTEFISLSAKHANTNSLRRIGYCLEQLGVQDRALLPLSKKLKSIKSWVQLIPNNNYKGKTNSKWRVINNAK